MAVYEVTLEDGSSYQIETEEPKVGVFGKVPVSQYQQGQRNIAGNIFERPGAALRNALLVMTKGNLQQMGQAYQQGAVNPTNVPSFQKKVLDRYYNDLANITSRLPEKGGLRQITTGVGAIPGFVLSAAGLGADIATEPANLLLGVGGQVPGIKQAGQAIASTRPAQAISRLANMPVENTGLARALGKLGTGVKAKIPKIMGDQWITQQAKQGQVVSEGISNALGNAYDDIYGKVGQIKIDPAKIDDVLLNSNLDDVVLKDIDNLVGGRIDTVEKAKMVTDILRKRTPASFYLQGGTSGKGGVANVKIRQLNTVRAIKEIMDESISSVDKNLGEGLKRLNSFAHEKVYPTLEKMRGIFGRQEIPATENIAPVYKGIFGKAAQRQTIRQTPKLSNEFKQYVSEDYQKDLMELIKNSKQMVKDMAKFRNRQLLKKTGGAAVGLGLGLGGYRFIRDKF